MPRKQPLMFDLYINTDAYQIHPSPMMMNNNYFIMLSCKITTDINSVRTFITNCGIYSVNCQNIICEAERIIFLNFNTCLITSNLNHSGTISIQKTQPFVDPYKIHTMYLIVFLNLRTCEH